jgi:protein SCO1/2
MHRVFEANMKYLNLVALLLLAGVVSSNYLGQHHSHGGTKPPVSDKVVRNDRAPGPGRVELPLKSFALTDSWLVDQNGKRVRFYSDLIKGKVVVISFFFTQCNDVCPMMGRSLAKLKTRLGSRLGRDVFLVSISKDPKNDTPAAMKKWAKEYGVDAGWTLVSGDQAVLAQLLWDFVGERIGPSMHESTLVIGNDKTGVWTSTDGLAFSDDVIKAIDDLLTAPP